MNELGWIMPKSNRRILNHSKSFCCFFCFHLSHRTEKLFFPNLVSVSFGILLPFAF